MSLRRARPLLGTLVDVRVDGLDATAASAAIDAAFAEIAQVHSVMSFHSPDSDLARLHRARAGQAVRVDRRTAEVLRTALRIAELSEGAFDPCVATIAVAKAILPRPASACVPKSAANWRDIELPGDDEVRLRRPLWIDLGGIAKGYAVDRAIDVLRAHGALQACVNAGGDLRIIGPDAERVALRIERGCPPRLIDLADGAVASSARGSALRLRHTNDADSENGSLAARVRGASVVAPTCMVADALTKVALLAPEEIVAATLAACGAQALMHRFATRDAVAGLAA